MCHKFDGKVSHLIESEQCEKYIFEAANVIEQ